MINKLAVRPLDVSRSRAHTHTHSSLSIRCVMCTGGPFAFAVIFDERPLRNQTMTPHVHRDTETQVEKSPAEDVGI